MTVEHYSFLVIRGRQGENIHYLIQCPLRLVPRLFLFDEAEVPVSLRQLHSLNTNRVEKVAQHFLSQPSDYTLAPLVATVDSDVEFESLSNELSDIGQLRIPLEARLIIHDGQHRRAAIAQVLAENPSLGNDTVPIMLIPDLELTRSAQIYSRLNQSPQRQTKSQRILHDHSSPLAAVVRQLVEDVPLFKGLTELEKTTISNRSTALFTLSAVYQATQALLGVSKLDPISADQTDLVRQFWNTLGHVIVEWREVIEGTLKSVELRQNYVHAHGVVLLALGQAGHSLITTHPDDWIERLSTLGEIDWSRKNRILWEGRTMIRGRMSKAGDNVKLTTNLLKKTLGVSLTNQEMVLEEKFLASK